MSPLQCYSDEKQPLILPCGQTVNPVNKMAKDLSSIEAKDVSRSKECESLKII